ncbi:MAG: thiamine phosphate synthase [Terriglobales bacterium]
MGPLYPILDVEAAAAHGHDLLACARGFASLGLGTQQLRAKQLASRDFLRLAEALAAIVPALIINDRADIAWLSGAGGVHAGQTDLPAAAVRELLPQGIVGVSTHTLEQARKALEQPIDYLAAGPVYATRSKKEPDAVVGVEFLRTVRPLTSLPLVAIGGIQVSNCRAVWAAGANAVAVISGLWASADPVSAASQFLLAFERV